MKTVNEVSKLTGVSIRTLQYYDEIGLLKPAEKELLNLLTRRHRSTADDTFLKKVGFP